MVLNHEIRATVQAGYPHSTAQGLATYRMPSRAALGYTCGMGPSSNETREAGYIGLIVLLLAAAVTVTLFIRVYITPRTTTSAPRDDLETEVTGTTSARTELERYRADIDAALSVQGVVQAHQEAEQTAQP